MMKIASVAFVFITTALTCLGQNSVLNRGNAYLNNEQYGKAEKVFRDGVEAEPKNLVYQCQLGLALIKQKKYTEAETTLNKVLLVDSTNIGAIWYSGIADFYDSSDKKAIGYFEKALTLVDKKSGQYYSANWFIGNCYANLLKTTGLTYAETDRMFECYNEYLRLQPDAEDAGKIREYVERKKKRRPSVNVKKWVDL